MTAGDGNPTVLVVGAGPAGLAVGACLRRRGVSFRILEQGDAIGHRWRRHYDRLQLHTARRHSALPYLGFPRGTPRYPSRDQVTAYLERYARHFALTVSFGERVSAIRGDGRDWEVATAAGQRRRADAVVVATGYNAQPVRPSLPGLDRFPGPVMHSNEYANGAALAGKRVLVVGFGNSGAEIAIDLHEHGARPAVAVRGPVNVLPREILGIPVPTWAIALSPLPDRLQDTVAAPLVRLHLGNLRRYGLLPPRYGSVEQISRRARIPVIDVGAIALIKRGELDVRPGVAALEGDTVVFSDGGREQYDALVLATGYRPDVDQLVDDGRGVVPDGAPRAGNPAPGLYLCGFNVVPSGMLRAINREARAIARDIAAQPGATREAAVAGDTPA